MSREGQTKSTTAPYIELDEIALQTATGKIRHQFLQQVTVELKQFPLSYPVAHPEEEWLGKDIIVKDEDGYHHVVLDYGTGEQETVYASDDLKDVVRSAFEQIDQRKREARQSLLRKLPTEDDEFQDRHSGNS